MHPKLTPKNHIRTTTIVPDDTENSTLLLTPVNPNATPSTIVLTPDARAMLIELLTTEPETDDRPNITGREVHGDDSTTAHYNDGTSITFPTIAAFYAHEADR